MMDQPTPREQEVQRGLQRLRQRERVAPSRQEIVEEPDDQADTSAAFNIEEGESSSIREKAAAAATVTASSSKVKVESVCDNPSCCKFLKMLKSLYRRVDQSKLSRGTPSLPHLSTTRCHPSSSWWRNCTSCLNFRVPTFGITVRSLNHSGRSSRLSFFRPLSWWVNIFPLLLAIILCIYILIVSWMFVAFKSSAFSDELHNYVDGLYFTVVAICSIGYGDIIPLTGGARAFTSIYVIVGRLLIVSLSCMVSCLLNPVEDRIIDLCFSCLRGESKVFRRLGMKMVITALYALILLIVGVVVLAKAEHLSLGEAIYLTISTITTVGFGDLSFKSQRGRIIACFWMLISTCISDRLPALLFDSWLTLRQVQRDNSLLRMRLSLNDFECPNGEIDLSNARVVEVFMKKWHRIRETELRFITEEFERLQNIWNDDNAQCFCSGYLKKKKILFVGPQITVDVELPLILNFFWRFKQFYDI